MERIKKTDGTYLTNEEMKQLMNDIEKAGTQIGEYLKIEELEGSFFHVLEIFIEIVHADVKENKIIFQLQNGNYLFEDNAVYPLSKYTDKKDMVNSKRFLAFLEWQVLKNIDEISKIYE